jgi:hypothetical protein
MCCSRRRGRRRKRHKTGEKGNHKLQNTNNKQAPNIKIQTATNIQNLWSNSWKFLIWDFKFVCHLGFGAWNL